MLCLFFCYLRMGRRVIVLLLTILAFVLSVVLSLFFMSCTPAKKKKKSYSTHFCQPVLSVSLVSHSFNSGSRRR